MNKTDEIIKLKELLDKNIITSDDFEKLKKEIFDNQTSTIDEEIITDVENKPNNNRKVTIIFVILLFFIGLTFVINFYKNSNKVNTELNGNADTTIVATPLNNQEIKQTPISNDTVAKSDSLNESDNDMYESIAISNIDQSDDNVYNVNEIDIKPQFQGGTDAFLKYFARNFQTPDEEGLSGKILMTFIVEKDGTLSEIKTIKDIGYNTGEEAKRVLKNSPKWSAGEKDGEKVRVLYSLPINISGS